MLPFLKNRMEGAMVAPVKKEEGADWDIVDAVAADLLKGLEDKDLSLIKSALQSLIDHLQNLDEKQDEEMK